MLPSCRDPQWRVIGFTAQVLKQVHPELGISQRLRVSVLGKSSLLRKSVGSYRGKRGMNIMNSFMSDAGLFWFSLHGSWAVGVREEPRQRLVVGCWRP